MQARSVPNLHFTDEETEVQSGAPFISGVCRRPQRLCAGTVNLPPSWLLPLAPVQLRPPMLPWTLNAPQKVTDASLCFSPTFIAVRTPHELIPCIPIPATCWTRPLNPRELSPQWSAWYALTPIIINFSSQRKFGSSTFANDIHNVLNTQITCIYRMCEKEYVWACTYLKTNLYWITEEAGWHPLGQAALTVKELGCSQQANS